MPVWLNMVAYLNLHMYFHSLLKPPPLKWKFKNKKDVNGRRDNIRDVNKFLEDDKWMEE